MAQKVCLIKSTCLCLLYVIHLIHLIQRPFFFTQIKNFSQDFYMMLFGTSFVTFFVSQSLKFLYLLILSQVGIYARSLNVIQ